MEHISEIQRISRDGSEMDYSSTKAGPDQEIEQKVPSGTYSEHREGAESSSSSSEAQSQKSADFVKYEQAILWQIRHTQKKKYDARVDQSLMKSVFLGLAKKQLKFANQKYNIKLQQLSPFMPQHVERNASRVEDLVNREKIQRERMRV